MSLSREFAAFVADLRYADLPPDVVDRAKGVTLQALLGAGRARYAGQPTGAGADAGGGSRRRRGRDRAVQRRKLTKSGAAFVNAEMIFAGGKWDTFRMLTHPGIAILPAALVAAEMTQCSGERIPDRRRRRLRGHGAHGVGVHPDGDVARLSRRAGVRHFRRGGRRREDSAASTPNRSTAPSRSASTWRPAIWKARAAAGGRCAKAAPSATRCWRWRWRSTARPAAKRRWKATPASITPTPATISASCATVSPVTTAPTWQDHRRSGPGLDLSRDAVPDLFDRRVQHRPCRRDGAAVRGARHHLRATSTASRRW